MIDDVVLKSAQKRLADRINSLEKIKLGQSIQKYFSFSDIHLDKVKEKIIEWEEISLFQKNNIVAIYRITAKDEDGAKALKQKFSNYKKTQTIKLPKNNKNIESKVIYVGRTSKIRQRLIQHLVDCAEGTYALKMGLWCPETEHKLKVEIAILDGNQNQAVLQDVEDELWRLSKPMFGKCGAR